MSSQQLLLGGSGKTSTYLNDVFSIDNYTTEGVSSLTEYGSVTTSTSGSPMSGVNYSVFNAAADRLVSGVSKGFAFGAGDFSIEAYVYRDSDSYPYSRILHFGPYWSSDDSVGFSFDDGDHANKVTFSSYKNRSKGTVPANGRILVSSSSVSSSTWYHCCVTRKNGVFRLFIDGKLEAINDSILYETIEDDHQQEVAIANTFDRHVQEPFAGRILGVRIIKGYVIDEYDTDATTVGSTVLFTPPTSAHPTTGPTNNCGAQGFVCCQSSNASDFSNSKRIINGIDLAKHGGLIWLKVRNATGWHFWMDTVRGFTGTNAKLLYSNRNNTESSTNALRCFNSDGFTLQNGDYNSNANQDVIAYTFRKFPGFFDIVAYTGNGNAGHAISHNLAATPQWMIVKALGGGTNSWCVYAQDGHAAIGSGGNSSTAVFRLDTNASGDNADWAWNDTAPTSTHFYVGDGSGTNSYNVQYIAYLFAGNDSFTGSHVLGKGADQSAMKMAFYNGNDSSDITINCGWEPGFVMIKSANDTNQYANWFMIDNMRGMSNKQSDGQRYLAANEYWEENNGGIIGAGSGDFVEFTTTGFKVRPGFRTISQGSPQRKYIYLAVRSPQPSIVKAKTDPNLLFALSKGANKSHTPNQYAPFASDMAIQKNTGSSDGDWRLSVRNLNTRYLRTNLPNLANAYTYFEFDYGGYGGKNGGSVAGGVMQYASGGYLGYHWRRSAGSFDYVMYTGNGVSGRTENHQLGSAPEMMWIKNVQGGSGDHWRVYHIGLNGGSSPQNYHLKLDVNNAEEVSSNILNNTAPSSTQITVGNEDAVNKNNSFYIAILFGSVAGVSKVGYYNGSGSTGNAQNIGFQPRFLIIKRRNSSGDWMAFDSQRGFGDYMQMNTTQQNYSQTYVNVSATGFSLVSDYGDTNESGSSYVYYAHA